MKQLHDKIQKYISICWDQYRCADKEKIDEIITETIKEHPNETNHIKLGMYAKRKCQGLIKEKN